MFLDIFGMNEYLFYPLIGAIAGALVFLISFLIGKSMKKGHVKVDEEFMATLFTALGGCENICKYSVDNSRVKFELVNLNLANLETLKELSPKGVFVTGNNIKTLFKYESFLIVKMLDKKLK